MFLKKIFNFAGKNWFAVLVFLLPLFWLPFFFERWEFPKLILLFSACLVFLAVKVVNRFQVFCLRQTSRRLVSLWPFDALVILSLLVNVVSAFFSVDKNFSVFGFYGRSSGSLIILALMAMVYFFISRLISQTQTQTQTTYYLLQTALSVSGLTAAAMALLAMLGGLKWLGLPNNFNLVAPSLEGLLIFLAPLIFLALERKNILAKALIVLSSILLLLVDYSPAWIIVGTGAFLQLAFTFLKEGKQASLKGCKTWALIVLFSISVLGLAINIRPLTTRFLSVPQEVTLDQETSWQFSFDAFKIKPLFGSGPGTFFYDFSRFRQPDFNQDPLWQVRFDRPISRLAEILATTGIIGILAHLALIIFGLWYSVSCIKNNGLGFTFLAVVIGQAVYYQNFALSLLFWLFLGLIAGLSAQKREISLPHFNFIKTELWQRTASVLGSLIAISVIVYIAFYGFKIVRADYLYNVAMKKDLGEEKIALLQKAAAINPSAGEYQILLSRNLILLALAESQKPGVSAADNQRIFQMVSSASTAANQATTSFPYWVAAWENAGILYQELISAIDGAQDWAIKSFQKAIELEPSNPLLHLRLAKIYFAANELDLAKESLARAKILKPDLLEPYLFSALVKEKEGSFRPAIEQLIHLQERYPLNIDPIFQLGRLYYNQNKPSEAIAQFEAVLKINPRHLDSLYSLALSYEKKKEINKAIDYLQRALLVSPNNETLKAKLSQLQK